LQQAHCEVKKLVLAVKELSSENEEQRANFKAACNQMQSYRSHLNFRLKIAQSKEATLLSEKFRQGESDQVVECLQQIIQEQITEIVSLKSQVEANPLLAQQYAKVQDLEAQLRGVNREGKDIYSLCNAVLANLEKVLRAHEDHNTEIALLEKEIHQGDSDDMLDCEMLDAEVKPEDGIVRFYQTEIAELNDRIAKLEVKNKQYLDLFCGSTGTNATGDLPMPQITDVLRSSEGLDTSHEALELLEETLNDLAAKSSQIEFLKLELQRT
jgi:hypothetical protein